MKSNVPESNEYFQFWLYVLSESEYTTSTRLLVRKYLPIEPSDSVLSIGSVSVGVSYLLGCPYYENLYRSQEYHAEEVLCPKSLLQVNGIK
jgi:hypothetical protein